MYSKPSNSDWSILFMTSLGAQGGGEEWSPCPSLRYHPSHRPTQQKQEPRSGALQGPARDLLVIWSQLHGLAGELRIKVVQAIVICDLGLEGRQGLLLFQLRISTRTCQTVRWSDGCQHPLPSSRLCMHINHGIKREAQLFNTPGISMPVPPPSKYRI